MNNEIICPICDREMKNVRSFNLHLSKTNDSKHYMLNEFRREKRTPDYEVTMMLFNQHKDTLDSLEDVSKEELKEKIEKGTPGLMICGGYQFLGKKYVTLEGAELEGLGIFQFETIAKEKRLVGNIILDSSEFGLIAGFENHSGRTYHNEKTLGSVKKGYGNDDESGKEGLRYNNIIGTYLHGPILPKNPKITDFILEKSIELKFGEEIKEKETPMTKYESIARKQALNNTEK